MLICHADADDDDAMMITRWCLRLILFSFDADTLRATRHDFSLLFFFHFRFHSFHYFIFFSYLRFSPSFSLLFFHLRHFAIFTFISPLLSHCLSFSILTLIFDIYYITPFSLIIIDIYWYFQTLSFSSLDWYFHFHLFSTLLNIDIIIIIQYHWLLTFLFFLLSFRFLFCHTRDDWLLLLIIIISLLFRLDIIIIINRYYAIIIDIIGFVFHWHIYFSSHTSFLSLILIRYWHYWHWSFLSSLRHIFRRFAFIFIIFAFNTYASLDSHIIFRHFVTLSPLPLSLFLLHFFFFLQRRLFSSLFSFIDYHFIFFFRCHYAMPPLFSRRFHWRLLMPDCRHYFFSMLFAYFIVYYTRLFDWHYLITPPFSPFQMILLIFSHYDIDYCRRHYFFSFFRHHGFRRLFFFFIISLFTFFRFLSSFFFFIISLTLDITIISLSFSWHWQILFAFRYFFDIRFHFLHFTPSVFAISFSPAAFMPLRYAATLFAIFIFTDILLIWYFIISIRH